ncbi:hypothetical protein Tsp_12094 [Trichinella spiralis]|uniref:hypothetical protein n=1 Tax=Trichinella spiralis TaxID=6334 RepID=UPI0001EFE8D0|nr:hypothetical protein Tsp_12094 [Trichinella spiralis]
MRFNFSLQQTLATTRDCFEVHDATGEYCNLYMAHRIFEMTFTTESTVLTIRYKMWYGECKRVTWIQSTWRKNYTGEMDTSVCTPSARQEAWNLDDSDSRDLSIRTFF